MKRILLFIAIVSNLIVVAQNGTIRGIVIENGSGLTIIGANVIVADPLTGTSTDLDGKFSLEIAPGVYDVKVSYISFEETTIKDVKVTAGEVTLLGNIQLRESSLALGEVVISATATRKSEAALNTMKKKSIVMMDGISAEKMALTGDGSAVEAAQRVTGVSIQGGKYIYVRGLGDRYSKVTLNNVEIPGLDPDKNSLQMDIFPTNIVDNIVVSKNFTADMSADFAGGVLSIETKDFPDEKVLNVSAGLAFNPDMHFNSDYLSYEGGKTDWLGVDDGTRKIPYLANQEKYPNPINGYDDNVTNDFVSSFNPTLAASRENSLMDYNVGISLGNQISLKSKSESVDQKNKKLGYIFSFSYKTDYKYYDEVEYSEYQRAEKSNEFQMVNSNIQKGELGEKNVLIGGLAGIAYQTNLTKIRLTLMHLQNGKSTAGKFSIFNNAEGVGQSGFEAVSDNLEYNQRTLTNLLLNGKHVLKDSGWEIDWRISPTYSTSDDPDIRKTAFTVTNDNSTFQLSPGAGGVPSRIWRELTEVSLTSKIDLSKTYTLLNDDAKLMFGASHTYKQRDYTIYNANLKPPLPNRQRWESPDANQILNPDNSYPNRPNQVYYVSGNKDPNPRAYNANVTNIGVYISNEMTVTENLRAILGVRMEHFVQRHTGRDQEFASDPNGNSGNNLDNEVVLNSTDFFPSVNLIYALAEEQNLRVAYSKTIARPSFKELSYAQILDPLTNRIFNGSFFQYQDENGNVVWDGNLTETRIDNIDLRWEKFMERGEIFSASLFYKKFDKPIELVRIPVAQTSTEFQPRNVGNGQLYGIELEATKNLAFISSKFENLSVSGNLTLVKSQIDMTDLEYNARKYFEKEGQHIDRKRAMAGQAPYVINFGLSYQKIEKGWSAGIFYNVKGPTLQIVGTGLSPDVYQQSFHSVNLGVNKKLGAEKRTTIDFNISNILNDKRESYYDSYRADEQIFSSFNPGRTFSVGISHKF